MRIPQDLPKPLQGTFLIEASAGTGKTETLSDLVLFLVAMEKRSLSEILVVTFTEAATEELKGRILQRLRQALETLDNRGNVDERLSYLLSAEKNQDEIRARIKLALSCFDEAAIFTIHGFCHKILKEHAFESGFLFDLEMIRDQRAIVQEIVDDFWRNQMATLPEIFVRHLHNRTGNFPDGLAGFAVQVLRQAQLEIILPEPFPDIADLEREASSGFQTLVEIWAGEKRRIHHLLLEDPGLNRRSYSTARLAGWITETDDFLKSGNFLQDWPSREKFHAENITKACKKGCEPLGHLFFDACSKFSQSLEALLDALDVLTLYFKNDLVDFARSELKARKSRLNIRSFDDLLSDFRDALHEGGGFLARVVREKFPVALVDEFQDTDPVQYKIFHTLYSKPESLLFLIGDPKQAIYSFRGADIFTYMKAGRHARKMVLDRNWRSAPKLVHSINALFGPHRNPFVFEEIKFESIAAARAELDGYLLEDGRPISDPMQIWFFRRQEESGVIDRKTADCRISEAVAGEISNLLDKAQRGRVTLGDRPLEAGDMAVIVRRNREALLIRDALRAIGIPAVIHSNESLFATREAETLLKVLKGVADPGSERAVRAALASPLFGLTWPDLYDLFENEEQWEGQVERFHNWLTLWQEQGFIAMAGDLLRREKIRLRLLSRWDGERQLTNLIHCLEILHHTAVTKHLGVKSLVKWFSAQIEERPEKDEYQLRLETDRQAVNVITIHHSKGLGFPVVFCPYSWDGLKSEKHGVFFHDPEADNRYCLDMGSSRLEERRKIMEREALAENLRLLYVALTRSKHRCYVAWGAFKGAESSALAYLFHSRPATLGNSLDGVFPDFSLRSDEELLADIEKRAELAGGDIFVTEAPVMHGARPAQVEAETAHFQAAEFSGRIDRGWELTSFTSLARGATTYDESRDRAEEFSAEEPIPAASMAMMANETADIFSFPRGSKAGLCLHGILEKFDFSLEDQTGTKTLVQEELHRYQFDAEQWTPVVLAMLAKVASAPLAYGASKFCLRDLKTPGRLTEMEFHFPVNGISSIELNSLIKNGFSSTPGPSLPEKAGQVFSARLQGFLKGFIDLVFEYQGRYYLIDWKSNFLGNSLEDYNRGNLQAVMDRELYHLQYHLYCLALHKFLRTRLPDYDYDHHFGSVFYFFLRGIDPHISTEYGIYTTRPKLETIEHLEKIFRRE